MKQKSATWKSRVIVGDQRKDKINTPGYYIDDK